MSIQTRNIGTWGEEQASRFLLQRGYIVLHRNYFCRVGEIDIVARDTEKRLLFIEVKTRSGIEGSAERATDYKKVEKIQKAALQYCCTEGIGIEDEHIIFLHISIYKVNETTIRISLYELV